MWISVLEDEAVLNNLITKYLQKEGYSVRSYLRGEDAVQGLDKPTDLWVIDIMLPDIDGFTVFREVQRKNPNSYVIFISARNQDIDRLAGLELGGDDYISKPFLVRELVIKVQRLLKGGRPKTAEVQVGPYTVHLEKHLVYCGSESISLTVSGNEAALQTVFDNLVENGLRYAASYIRMELTGEEEGGYLLTVENDGAPIPQPTLNVLFQKFYKGADGNFGLGLYIAKKIVQFHKGDIWASNWADGVRFQLLLRREDRMAGRR